LKSASLAVSIKAQGERLRLSHAKKSHFYPVLVHFSVVYGPNGPYRCL